MAESTTHGSSISTAAYGMREGSPAKAPGQVHEVRQDPLVGASIEGFLIESVLGKGGMGRVYGAVNERQRHCGDVTLTVGQRVALKLMDPGYTRDSESVERFEREARIAGIHRNICRVYEFGPVTSDQYQGFYIAMELLVGEDLESLLSRSAEKRLDPARIVGIARQSVEGLLHLHEQAGAVHRDLKPQNIFILADDFVKVIDFGLARRLNTIRQITVAGSIFGTVEYMAPEQATGTAPTLSVDIYSFGVTLYRMLTGEVPITGLNAMGVLSRKSARETHVIPPITTSGASSQFKELILSLIAFRPEERPASMREVREALLRTPEGLRDSIAVMKRRGSECIPSRLLATACCALASACEEGEDIKGAIDARADALMHRPQDPELRHTLATKLLQLGRVEEAIQVLKVPQLRAQAADLPLWLLLGATQLRTGDAQGALASFSTTVTFAVDSQGASEGFGIALARTQNVPGGIEHLTRLAEKQQLSPAGRLELVHLLEAEGEARASAGLIALQSFYPEDDLVRRAKLLAEQRAQSQENQGRWQEDQRRWQEDQRRWQASLARFRHVTIGLTVAVAIFALLGLGSLLALTSRGAPSSPKPVPAAPNEPSVAGSRAQVTPLPVQPAPPSAIPPGGSRLRIKGSETIGGTDAVGQKLKDMFTRINHDAAVTVEGLGTATGFQGLFDDTADMAFASRTIDEDESFIARRLGWEPQMFVFAWDHPAVIVNLRSSLKHITLKELTQIYKDGTNEKYHPISRHPYSGTYDVFKDALGLKEFGPCVFKEKNDDIVSLVRVDPLAIAYVGAGAVTPDIQVVDLANDASQQAHSYKSDDYPIRRPLLIYTRGAPSKAAANFIRFLATDDAQSAVEQVGFFRADSSALEKLRTATGSEAMAPRPTVKRLSFQRNESQLDQVAKTTLTEIAGGLREEGKCALVVGNASVPGTQSANGVLATNRAEKVANFLKDHQVDAKRIASRGVSASLPVSTNTTSSGQNENQRVDVYVHPCP